MKSEHTVSCKTMVIWIATGALMLACGLPAAHAATTYALDQIQPLLDADFYLGNDNAAGQAGTAPGGRSAALGAVNNAGTEVAFFSIEIDGFSVTHLGLFVVDIGDTSSWQRVAENDVVTVLDNIAWSQDDTNISTNNLRFNLANGLFSSVLSISGAFINLTHIASTATRPDPFIITSAEVGISGSTTDIYSPNNITAGGSFANGAWNSISIALTNFGTVGLPVRFLDLSKDGAKAAFTTLALSSDPMVESDVSKVYVLDGAGQMFDGAFGLFGISPDAPTALTDPLISHIRTTEGSRFKGFPRFTEDASLLIYSEDFNDAFSLNDLAGTLPLADFDIMISNSDGTAIDGANSGTDLRLVAAGNQLVSDTSKGGLRLVLQDTGAMPTDPLQLLMATVIIGEDIAADSTSVAGDTIDTGDGGMIVLSDSAVKTVTEVLISDAAGTEIVLPPDQVINFPDGSGTTEITISTPIDPVEEAQLPLDAPVDAIPVVRDFGPEGTEFFPPIEITITYTDAEVAGLDETSLTPFLFNPGTGIFDTPVPESDIVSRDPINNTITFLVGHFSTYGLGGSRAVGMPVGGRPAAWVLLALLAVASVTAIRRSGRQR